MPVKSKSDPTTPPACPRCQNPRRANERFCYNCGLELREDAGEIEAYLSKILPTRVDAILKARLSEQKLVEVETAELLAERAMKWMKTIGYFVGIPLLAASVVLSFFGYKTYSDFEKASEKAAQFAKRIEEETARFEPAQQKIAALDKSVQEATQKVREQLAQIDASQKQLQGQVKSLEDRLAFTPSKDLSPELQSALQKQLSNYIKYLEKIGFFGLETKINICLFSEQDFKNCNISAKTAKTPNAFYDGTNMFVHVKLSNMPSVILHEYTHHALRQSRTMRDSFSEIDEALADYFASSYLDDPIIGEGFGKLSEVSHDDGQSYIRNLDNVLKYVEQPDDANSRGNVWGGVMWACRSELGQSVMDEIALKAWRSLTVAGREPNDFGKALIDLEAGADMAGKPPCLSREIAERGLPH
jgi:hypothetical protein